MIPIAEWIGSRRPAPPPELAQRLASLAGDRQCADTTELAQFLTVEAVALLDGLRDDRLGATDLLVADSLITYAVEALATDCRDFEVEAVRMMREIAPAAARGPRQ